MILSNVEIQRALDARLLVIDPEPVPRTPPFREGVCPYQTTAIDLRLGNEIAYLQQGLAIDLNLNQGSFKQFFKANSRRETLSDERPFVLRPGRLVLGQTYERIALPISAEDGYSLAARIEGRSSYARFGLLVHLTAPTIHCGFEGNIALELCNLGPANIALYPLTPICQLIVEAVKGIPFRNDSQFQGQATPGGHVTA